MLITQSVTDPIAASELCDDFIRDGGKAVTAKLQTVLVVDDDDMLRKVMEACLRMSGYDVVACNDAYSALLAFGSYYVDILLTDLQMPGKSGVELARELTDISPDLPVLVVSASLLSEEMLSEIQHRGWRFIAKPCSLAALLGAMESLLGKVRQAAAA